MPSIPHAKPLIRSSGAGARVIAPRGLARCAGTTARGAPLAALLRSRRCALSAPCGAGELGVCALACWYPQQYGGLLQRFVRAERRRGGGGGSMPASPRTTATGGASNASDPGSPAGREQLHDKWWADTDEPLYLVVTPAAVVEARPCDADDNVRWLLQRREYAAAVAAAAAAPYIRPETWQACAAEYVEHLLDEGDTDGAHRAARCAVCCGCRGCCMAGPW